MDPASVVGLVSACFSLAGQISSTIKGLNDLRGKYKGVEENTVALISHVNIVRSSVDALSQWLSNPTRRRLPDESETSLKAAIDCCAMVIAGINRHVSYAQDPSKTASMKDRVRYVWNESTISDHVHRLDSQIGSLNLWLQVSHFTNIGRVASVLQEETSIHVFQAAQDDAASYSQRSLHNSQDGMSRMSLEFAFDDDIIRSGPYVQHYRNMTRKVGSGATGRNGIESIPEEARPIKTPQTTPSGPSTSSPASTGLKLTKASPFGNVVRRRTSSMLEAFGLSGLGGHDRREHGKSLLIVAAQGNLQRVQQLLDLGADANYKSETDGESALHKAARAGHSGAIALLTSKQAKPNLKNRNGETALMLATPVALDAVNALIRAGAKVDLKNNNQWTSLHIAAEKGSPGVIEALIQAGAAVNEKTKTGRTALHLASYHCNTTAIRSLLAANAWVNVKWNGQVQGSGILDETPLHRTCNSPKKQKENRFTAVKLLIEAGADVNALATQKMPTASSRSKAESKVTALHMLARDTSTENHHSESVRSLLRAGAELRPRLRVEVQGLGHSSPKAHYTARQMYYTTRHVAIANNAISHVLNSHKVFSKGLKAEGWTPLHTAALHGAYESAEYILQKDKWLESHDIVGTPLHVAAFQGYSKLVKLLLRNGENLDIDARAKSKHRTPLHHAVIGARRGQYRVSYGVTSQRSDHSAVISLLLKEGAEVNARDENGQTPLHYTAFGEPCNAYITHSGKSNHLSLVKVLVEKGADINATDKKGKTPLYKACLDNGSAWSGDSIAEWIAKTLLQHGADLHTVNKRNEDLVFGACRSRRLSNSRPVLMKFLSENGLAVSESHYDKLWEMAKEKKKRYVAGYTSNSLLGAVILKYNDICATFDQFASPDIKTYGKSIATRKAGREYDAKYRRPDDRPPPYSASREESKRTRTPRNEKKAYYRATERDDWHSPELANSVDPRRSRVPFDEKRVHSRSQKRDDTDYKHPNDEIEEVTENEPRQHRHYSKELDPQDNFDSSDVTDWESDDKESDATETDYSESDDD